MREPLLPFAGEAPRAPVKVNPVAIERDRLTSARGRVLARLREGPATNLQLNEICFRYGARIEELRKAGVQIVTERVDGGVFVYRLEAASR